MMSMMSDFPPRVAPSAGDEHHFRDANVQPKLDPAAVEPKDFLACRRVRPISAAHALLHLIKMPALGA